MDRKNNPQIDTLKPIGITISFESSDEGWQGIISSQLPDDKERPIDIVDGDNPRDLLGQLALWQNDLADFDVSVHLSVYGELITWQERVADMTDAVLRACALQEWRHAREAERPVHDKLEAIEQDHGTVPLFVGAMVAKA